MEKFLNIAKLLVYKQLGILTNEELRELETWYASRQQGRELSEKLADPDYRDRAIRLRAEFDPQVAWEALQSKRHREHRRRILRKLRWSAAGTAVVVMIGVALWNGVERVRLHSEVSVPTVIASGGERAVIIFDDGKQVDVETLNDSTVLSTTNNTVLKRNGQIVFADATQQASVDQFNTVLIPRGGEYQIVLPDSTRVWLNSESKLRFPVKFSDTRRDVYLSGEAYFQVRHNARAPFTVHTDTRVNVRVLGTEFNISTYDSQAQTRVTLAAGSVEVEAGHQVRRMVPDQQSVISASGAITVRRVDARLVCQWYQGILNFEGVSLRELCDNLARWYDVEFVFEDPKLENLTFTGAAKRKSDLNYTLSIIELTTDVTFITDKKSVYVKRKNV